MKKRDMNPHTRNGTVLPVRPQRLFISPATRQRVLKAMQTLRTDHCCERLETPLTLMEDFPSTMGTHLLPRLASSSRIPGDSTTSSAMCSNGVRWSPLPCHADVLTTMDQIFAVKVFAGGTLNRTAVTPTLASASSWKARLIKSTDSDIDGCQGTSASFP
jgi:hypothetical protein